MKQNEKLNLLNENYIKLKLFAELKLVNMQSETKRCSFCLIKV